MQLLVKVERIHSFNYGGKTAEKYLFFDGKSYITTIDFKNSKLKNYSENSSSGANNYYLFIKIFFFH